MRWFDQKSRPRAAAFVAPVSGPQTIWVSAALDCAGIVRAVGHEVQHLAQSLRGDVLDEFHAARYGEKLAGSDRHYWPIEVGAGIYDR